MVKLSEIRHVIESADGVTPSIANATLSLTGPKGSISREFSHQRVNLSLDGENIVVQCDLPRRKEKALAGTWRAHINNMMKGVTEGHEYQLKAVYSHFPMTLKVNGSKLEIKNLFGEKVPRIADLKWTPTEVTVSVQNKTEVVVTGVDREKVGQTAAIIERACKIRRRDRRVFQDGVYIVSKGSN